MTIPQQVLTVRSRGNHESATIFLLEDLVTDDYAVKFFMPFDDFKPPSFPKEVGTYKEYRRRSIEFIEARNHRIRQRIL